MGRLPSLIACAACALVACNDDKSPPTPPAGGRSEAVLAKSAPSAAPLVATSAPAVPAASIAAPKAPPRHLCESEVQKSGRALPRATFDTAAASGAVAPEAHVDTGGGRWTWINFFAAWCAPCKEEIPRLRGWEQKLSSSLRVRFVSLDDDERQLDKFLNEQPATGVRASLWLKPGANRDGFLQGLKLGDPSLPAHALVDPQGKVRCAFSGAVEDGDLPQIESIVTHH